MKKKKQKKTKSQKPLLLRSSLHLRTARWIWATPHHLIYPEPWTPKVALRPSGVLLVSFFDRLLGIHLIFIAISWSFSVFQKLSSTCTFVRSFLFGIFLPSSQLHFAASSALALLACTLRRVLSIGPDAAFSRCVTSSGVIFASFRLADFVVCCKTLFFDPFLNLCQVVCIVRFTRFHHFPFQILSFVHEETDMETHAHRC